MSVINEKIMQVFKLPKTTRHVKSIAKEVDFLKGAF